MTTLSRVTGLARDILFARLLGASTGISADAFYMAFTIPNFFRRIFGEGAFSQAFVPVLMETKTKQGEQATQEFVAHMSGRFGLLLFGFSLIGVIAAPLFIMMFAGGYLQDKEKFDLTATLLRIMFPYIMFISLVSFAAGVLNTHKKFAAAAFTPVFLNVCLIIAVVYFSSDFKQPVTALAWGVFAAGIVQLIFQFPFLLRIRMLRWPRLKPHPEVTRTFKLMIPAIIGSSMSQINMIVNRILASFLVTGSVTWLYFSDRLMEFPLAVFGIALATVVLPSLSKKHADKSPEEFSCLLDWSLRWVFLVSIPATIGLIVLAKPILTTLFHYGAFTAFDVEMTARALMAFAGGLLGFVSVKVLAPGFYARQDTKTPAKIAVIAFGTNIILSLALVFPLQHVGLAIAISLSAFVNAGLLYRGLRAEKVYRPRPGWGLFLLRVLLASLTMGSLAWWGAGDISSWISADVWTRITRLTTWIMASILLYGATLWLVGLRPRALRLEQLVSSHE